MCMHMVKAAVAQMQWEETQLLFQSVFRLKAKLYRMGLQRCGLARDIVISFSLSCWSEGVFRFLRRGRLRNMSA